MHIVEENNVLKEIGFEVIKEEKLPVPEKIHFKCSVYGNRKTLGKCFASKSAIPKFRILINSTKAHFIPDVNGKYRNKITGQKCRRGLGIDLTLLEKADTLAHEIAHLCFWNHDAKHTSYTKYLYEIIKVKLVNRGINV